MRVGGRAGLCVSCSLVLSPGVGLQGQRGMGRMLTEEGECRAWRHSLEFDFADSAGLIELSPLVLVSMYQLHNVAPTQGSCGSSLCQGPFSHCQNNICAVLPFPV